MVTWWPVQQCRRQPQNCSSGKAANVDVETTWMVAEWRGNPHLYIFSRYEQEVLELKRRHAPESSSRDEAGVSGEGLERKSLIFPTKTSTSYVRLYPQDYPNLSAFTLCLRAASEASHEYALFSYATSNHDNELLIWQRSNGGLSLEFGDAKVEFFLPKMNALLRHICVTCESAGGMATFWVNGERSIRKVVKRGGIVHVGGVIILGQDQDSVGGGFDWSQSFVGEITDVNMWDHVLTASEIKAVSQGCHCPGGNIIDWATIRYTASGKVNIQDNDECATSIS
ncbi:mucosal pentraxin-like [Carcharodon carcharias]|uniref:mucosal pentraxin-like n=1 Tax=Carcharodon carcharias TaxID=13397 RepID=UPI001B7E92D5|nr:mucosal pentraxin-like [Carcharodon carcharias]